MPWRCDHYSRVVILVSKLMGREIKSRRVEAFKQKIMLCLEKCTGSVVKWYRLCLEANVLFDRIRTGYRVVAFKIMKMPWRRGLATATYIGDWRFWVVGVGWYLAFKRIINSFIAQQRGQEDYEGVGHFCVFVNFSTF
jgi:hypothetical protein